MDRSYQDQISSLQSEENKERCIRLFNELDPEGQEIVLEYMTYLVSKGTYNKTALYQNHFKAC